MSDQTAARNETLPPVVPQAASKLGRPTPLWSVIALTWLTSIGTAIGWTGIFFVADAAFGFTKQQNLWLGVLMGASNASGAFFAAPVLRAIRKWVPRANARSILAGCIIASALINILPLVVAEAWTLWVYGPIYVALAGLIWPNVETYVSGGRRGQSLRKSLSSFNLSWASAVMIAMWLIAPMMKETPLSAMQLLLIVHLASLVLLYWHRREPGEHGTAAHPHTPDEALLYIRLRKYFRISLFGSYVVHSALTPMIPQFLDRLAVDPTLRPIIFSTWMVTRLIVFAVMGRWGGWHGRKRTVIIAAAAMLGGFIIAITAGTWLVLAVGLGLMGIGVGAAYAGAIYYALEVGSIEVDAGGKHESLIGLGYTVGPLAGLGLVRIPGVAGA